MVFGHSVASQQHPRHGGNSGGRERESNPPRAAEQPQPALKAGRPTGAASLPSASIVRMRQLGNETGLISLFQATAIKPQPAIAHASNDWPREGTEACRECL